MCRLCVLPLLSFILPLGNVAYSPIKKDLFVMRPSPSIHNVPCTLVTGFLGAGKTTLINRLLATKVPDARWALLINEFGRIGIDGALVDGAAADKAVAIREVSGGCICCTSQLPLQIAIMRLLAEHRPDRLLIEPTGLAHPKVLTQQLSEPHWQNTLSMRAVMTVLHAGQWQQPKYRKHDGYCAHIKAADVVLVNRYETLDNGEREALSAWIQTLNANARLIWDSHDDAEQTQTSAVLSELLNSQSHLIGQQTQRLQRFGLQSPQQVAMSTPKAENTDAKALPYRYHDIQEGVLIAGWRLPSDWQFDGNALQDWLLALPDWQRIKGVVHTKTGWQQLNFTPDSVSTRTTEPQADNRLEVILSVSVDDKNQEDNAHKKAPSRGDNPIDWAPYDTALMDLVLPSPS